MDHASVRDWVFADCVLQIEDYEPRHSIVITPTKMVKYYDDVKLSNELYPWSSTFGHLNSRISWLTLP